MKTLYIIRGVPGSGKTTYANSLGVPVIEADHYFMSNGQYIFNSKFLPEAHTMCKNLVETIMALGKSDVAVANTFTTKWEYEPYLKMAEKYNYSVVIHKCEGNYTSVHNVPLKIIEQMKKRFEN